MPVELVVEDGSNVADANTFVTFEEIQAYAEARGRSLPMTSPEEPAEPEIDEAAVNILAIKAMDYIVSRRLEYQGEITYTGEAEGETKQLLPFPRTGLYIDGVEVADDEIPIEVKNLQCELVCLAAANIDFFPATNDRALRRSKTGPLEKEWFAPGLRPVMLAVDAMIAPLLGAGAFALRTRRV